MLIEGASKWWPGFESRKRIKPESGAREWYAQSRSSYVARYDKVQLIACIIDYENKRRIGSQISARARKVEMKGNASRDSA